MINSKYLIVALKAKTIWLIVFIVSFGFTSCRNDPNDRTYDHVLFEKVKNEMVIIPSGILNMGGDNDQADRNEFPKHKVKIDSFLMDKTEVTNLDFQKFVEATGYVTLAEREVSWEQLKTQLPPNTPKPADSLLAPGALVFVPTTGPVSLRNSQLWWQWVLGANWQKPYGPESSIEDIMDHPVVHIAWEDAKAYCDWIGKRLPTEAEWEWAARGGLDNQIYPWGNESVESGSPKANFYQGIFPFKNTLRDGYENTSPVKSFAPNGYGLYDMSGNVWELCDDWFDENYYSNKTNGISTAIGPSKSFNPRMPYQQEKVIRGGSYLCNDDYCSGYRNARRMGTTIDTGLSHTGFRCMKEL